MLGGATCVSEIGPCNASCMVLYVFMCSLVLLCMFYVFLRIFARLCKVSYGFTRFLNVFLLSERSLYAFLLIFAHFCALWRNFTCFNVFFDVFVLSGRSWALVGHSWVFLGRSWTLLGRSWALLERSWALLGRSWDTFGALLGPCWG